MGKREQWGLVLVYLMLCFTFSCTKTVYKSPAEMLPKERAVLAMSMYNNAYDNYIRQFKDTAIPFSPEMVEYFTVYKSVLKHAWPVISAYDSVVSINTYPSPEMDKQILDVIYQLESMVKGAIQ